MTVKDHSTGLVYLAALPKKKAEIVASELEKHFGFAGFPHILHTDNGKEFIATLVVEMMMRHNPDCFIVTGGPRTPRDQGSVENANKLVKQVLMSLSRKRRMQCSETNWMKILDQVMSMCNSHSGIRKYSTSSYQAVFGQPYHPELRCTVAELRECTTIGQRLNLSPDDRLAKYVREYDIVDYISKLAGGGSSLVSNDDDADVNGDNEEEGLDLSDDAFPDALSDNDADDDGAECPSLPGIDFSAGSVDVFSEFQSSPTQELCAFSVPVEGSTKNLCAGDGQSTTTSSMEACGTPAITQDHDHTAKKVMNQSDDIVSLSSTSSHEDRGNANRCQNVNWSYARAAEYSTFTVAEAWEHGNIARKQSSLGDNCQYNFLWSSFQAATVISAAAKASEKAEIDPNYLCSFCYCDSPDMDVLRLECCQNTVH